MSFYFNDTWLINHFGGLMPKPSPVVEKKDLTGFRKPGNTRGRGHAGFAKRESRSVHIDRGHVHSPPKNECGNHSLAI